MTLSSKSATELRILTIDLDKPYTLGIECVFAVDGDNRGIKMNDGADIVGPQMLHDTLMAMALFSVVNNFIGNEHPELIKEFIDRTEVAMRALLAGSAKDIEAVFKDVGRVVAHETSDTEKLF